MKKQSPHLKRMLTFALFAALAAGGSLSNLRAETKAGEATEVALDDLVIGDDGKMALNGEEIRKKEPGPEAFILAEVNRVLPSIEGSNILILQPVEFRVKHLNGEVTTTMVKGEPKQFLHINEMVLYNAEGGITKDVSEAYRVLMPNPGSSENLVFQVIWNECDGAVTGNYIGYKCSKKRGMSNEFASYLKENILACVNSGLANVGGGSASKVHIIHDGTVADENHSGSSLHAAGRAVDIMSMKVTSGRGTTEYAFKDTSSKPNGPNRKFYEGLRSCWGKLQAKRRCPGRSGGPIGTIGWEDRRHKGHHLHMSMPFCPNSRGYFITGK